MSVPRIAGLLFLLTAPLLAQAPPASPIPSIVSLLQQKDFTGAAHQATLALKTTPGDPRLWTLKGMALASADPHTPAPALAAFNHALALSPDLLPALEAAAQLEFSSGNSHARVHLQHVLDLRPAEPTANAMLAVLDFRAADFAAAATHFQLATPVIASQPASLAQYATSLANTNRLAEAIPIFQQVASLQPNNPNATYNLALAECNAKQTDSALAHLQPLLSASDPAALTLAADILESQGKTQPALDLLHRAILAAPKDPQPYLDLANLSFAHSSVQVGIDVLDAGLRQLPNDARLYLTRGILSAQLGHNEAATADFEAANRLDPHLSVTGTAVGIAQSQQHHSAEALATFRANARQHPSDPLTHYLLAEALSEEDQPLSPADAAEERASALRASQLDPKLTAAHDLLATIYLRDNDVPHAIQQSEAALATDPADQQALFHLVLATRRSTDPQQKAQLPDLLKRLAAARSAPRDAAEQPRGYLTEAP